MLNFVAFDYIALAVPNAPPTLTGGIGYAGYTLSLVYILDAPILTDRRVCPLRPN